MERKKLRKGVFMVAYSLESGKPEYIIQHRKLHWKGWEFPKAGLKKGESKKEAARREIKEETGLEIIKVTSHKYKGKFLYPKELPDRPGISGQTYYLYSVELKKGKIKVDIETDKIEAVLSDEGPGIENIDQAMQDGYSTASEEVREMGFGAGMGLSNMKKNSDGMKLQSEVNKGTTVAIVNYLS